MNSWHVTLLRALITGDLEIVERDVIENLDALTKTFTSDMPQWQLEWETTEWYKIQNASAVFIASVFARPNVLRWLLERGADRDLKCHIGQTALSLAGECRDDNNEDDIEECINLLSAPASAPGFPTDFRIEEHFGTELVRKRVKNETMLDNGEIEIEERIVQVEVEKCTLQICWETPLSHGSLIDGYEVRFKAATGKGGTADGHSQRGWKVEVAKHARTRLEQGVSLPKLDVLQQYYYMVRSKNGSGFGDWCPTQTFHTNSLLKKNSIAS